MIALIFTFLGGVGLFVALAMLLRKEAGAWFNPFFIVALSIAPVWVMKNYVSSLHMMKYEELWYQFSLLMHFAHYFFMFLSFVAFFYFFKSVRGAEFGLSRSYISQTRLCRFALVFLFLFVLCFFLLAYLGGGGDVWIYNPRRGYQFYRVGVGYLYILSISFLSLSYCFYAFSLRELRAGSIFVMLLYIFTSYFFGSKTVLLSFGVFLILVCFILSYKYRYLALLVISFGVFAGLLVNFFVGLGGVNFDRVLLYFDYHDNSAMMYEAFYEGELTYFWGEIFSTDFWRYLPRAYFEDKPYVYGFLHVNEFFFPGAAERTHTPAFSAPARYFADFSYVGVFVFSVFNVAPIFWAWAVSGWIKVREGVRSGRVNSLYLLIAVFSFSPSFLFLMPLVYVVFIFLLFVLFLKVFSSKLRGEHEELV